VIARFGDEALAADRLGDEALEIEARDAAHARRLARVVERIEGVLEVVVGWDRVVAHLVAPDRQASVLEALERLEPPPEVDARTEVREHVVPVVYDGPDLAELASAAGLAPEEVARRHAAGAYVVEVIGFLPGFAYLGGLDPSLARPRRPTPRPRVAAGSVGIAGPRTAIYPLPSPGGWNLIGRAVGCAPFDPRRAPPSLFAVGDRVRFAIAEVGC
jgi:KipI family sensor histidine kinase inhibitor